MPKIITDKQREQIKKFALKTNQSEAARHFGVYRMFVNALVNNRPIITTRPQKERDHITGIHLW